MTSPFELIAAVGRFAPGLFATIHQDLSLVALFLANFQTY
jgi:hypothetical protein